MNNKKYSLDFNKIVKEVKRHLNREEIKE